MSLISKHILAVTFILIPLSIFSYIIDTNVVTGLNKPVVFAFLPDTNVIITLKDGPVKIYSLNNTLVSLFWDFTDSTITTVEQGVIGVTLDPAFESNRYIYIYYINSNPHQIRVVRFTENNNHGTSPVIILSIPFGAYTNHVAGNIHFGYDSKLYVAIGELYDSLNAQMKTNPFGKILRINSNGTIPTDNPFYDDGNPNTGYDDRIWCYGLRNPFDFCFSPVNDSLYLADNGYRIMDEADFIRKGKNFGWPICEGDSCRGPSDSLTPPIRTFIPTEGTTGSIIYNGSSFPALYNHMLVATYNFGTIYNCTLSHAPFYDSISTSQNLLNTFTGLTTILQGPDGNIYGLVGGYIVNGKLFRIRNESIGIHNQNEDIPEGFALFQNYPNPFNPSTNIKYQITKNSFVKLVVYNVLGEEISVLVNENQKPGTYEVSLNAENFPSGVYFCKLVVGDNANNGEYFTAEKKMVLLK